MRSVIVAGVIGSISIVAVVVRVRGRVDLDRGSRHGSVPVGVLGNIVREIAYERRR